MPAYVSDVIAAYPASRFEREKDETLLAAMIGDLAVLRFSIVITGKWEVAESEDAERRDELRNELSNLRHLYFEKLDQLAMTFGVEQAMKAKEEVEGTFRTAKTSITPGEAGQLNF